VAYRLGGRVLTSSHPAHERGVKIIGATAHFLTPHLYESPIITQFVARVSHSATAEALISIGRDIEHRILSEAVKLSAEDRIFIVSAQTLFISLLHYLIVGKDEWVELYPSYP
jgi:formyltetrahydrofolate deformylase